MANIIKLYAAYKAGFLGNNILDTYFSFIANMISEERLAVVEDTVIAAKFKERYTKGTVYRTVHPDSFTLLVQTQERIPLFSIRQTDPLTLRIETSTNTTLSRVVLREAIYETGPAEIIYA